IKGLDAAEANRASQWIRSRDCLLSNVFSTENPVLISLPEWDQASPADIEKTEESETSGGASVDVTEQDESCDSLMPAQPSNPTWLESRQEAIRLMISENETVPENERLELKEFNLDMEEQMRLDSMVQQEVSRVRNESERRNQEKLDLCDVLKREHWDSMKVKGKAVKAFYSDREVRNYPMRERTERELEDLRRVENIRVLEKAVCAQRQLEKSSTNEPEQEAKEHEAEDVIVTGSFSAELGCSHPHLYDQVSLQTIEQMINQIILLQDVTHKLKTAFNAEFDVVHRQKLQEINRLRDRNTQIRDIMLELGIKGDLWEPDVTASEKPEKLFTVDDSEIKVEKYLSPEKRKEEERKKLEEERRLAAKRDNIREKALDDMMDGSLEMKKDGFLLKEVPPPEFSLTKPHTDWSEEERKEYKEYEKKAEELNVEKEKYKKSLEVEMKKLQAATKDATERFDETFKRLFENKIKYEMAVQQEELKITHLAYSVRMDEVMGNRQVALRLKLEKLLAYKDEIEEVVKKREPELELYHETYEDLVAEDKVLEKDFKKNFANAPKHIVDQLFKLFKRRPRLQKMRAQTDNNSFRGPETCASLTPNGLDKMVTAMEELDAPENMPDVLNLSMWEKLCAARRNKVESEQKVRATALTLAEMQAFLQNRKDEAKAAQEEIKNIRDELESLHKEKNRVLLDTMVQLPLKQGQVEVSPKGLAPDYSDSILLHRTIVEDLNRVIQTIGEQKISFMVRTKDIRKDIIQLEWENNMRTMKINNLKSDVRTIQGLRLTEEQKQAQLKDLQLRKQKIEQLHKRAAIIVEKNTELEEQIQDMRVIVADMTRIYEATGSGQNELAKREERYQAVLRRRKLKDTVQAQAEELAQLNAELQRQMMRNFPSVEMMKH
ncbi:cilia- and flagella-associated protein 43-like, partial [Lampetra planeri]